MKFIHGVALDQRLGHFCQEAKNRVVFVSAYTRNEAFLRFAGQLDPDLNMEKILVTRWGFSDLVSGASDLDVYRTASELGWTVYLQPNLHAKLYIMDNMMLLGSANMTLSGFQLKNGLGNIEACVEDSLDPEVEGWVQRLVRSSVELDDVLFKKMENEVQSCPREAQPGAGGFSREISDALKRKPEYGAVFTKDFIWSPEISMLLSVDIELQHRKEIEHDAELLDVAHPANYEELKTAFLLSQGWSWLSSNASQPVYFGELTERLHDALEDDPKVYRKTVKQLLQNLLAWSQALCPEKILIDTPNVSQRIHVL
jgi:hypothetical protein